MLTTYWLTFQGVFTIWSSVFLLFVLDRRICNQCITLNVTYNSVICWYECCTSESYWYDLFLPLGFQEVADILWENVQWIINSFTLYRLQPWAIRIGDIYKYEEILKMLNTGMETLDFSTTVKLNRPQQDLVDASKNELCKQGKSAPH